MFSKGIIAVMLILVFLIPGAYGISVSIAGAEGGSSFYDTATFNEPNHNSLSVHSTVNGATLEQDASGSGDLHKSFGANNHRGEKAQIMADVVNAGNWKYTQPSIVAGDTYAGVSGFLLTATNADSIKCTSGASDRQGDKASTSTEVSYGSLYNYQGDAYATNGGVRAWQSFGGADAASVSVNEKASNQAGSSATSTNVVEGGINRYLDYINDGTFANPEMAKTIGVFDHASGKEVESESSAYRSAGHRSNAKMDVTRTNSYWCYVDGFLSTAGEGPGFETEASQQVSGTANGYTIGFSLSSLNTERDISSANAGIQGTEIRPGEVYGYYGLTKSSKEPQDFIDDLSEPFQNGVYVDNYLGTAYGEEIHLSSSSSNGENDRANANMNIVGSGQISNRVSSSSATAKTASASNSYIDFGSSVSGNAISFEASASDAARNRASVSTLLLGGFIIDPLNSAAVDNTVMQSLTTNQGAYFASGSELKIDAKAINAAKLQKSLNTIYIPIGTGYGNFANVMAGNPEAFQSP